MPAVIHGQQFDGKKLGFYTELAFKDAVYEHSFQLNTIEDELDYWKDQYRFEQSLKEKDAWAYQVYLNGKQKAYNEHRGDCSDACQHSDFYFRKASYYAIHGAEQLSEEMVFSRVVNKPSSLIRNPQ
ncbi:hypothetical protein [Allomuricauda sp. d1]|uniref:hypothetical protein n=1 Tax=Allomuricauda sp. d1 TaxID=3136725 RepID=UPI0031CE9567